LWLPDRQRCRPPSCASSFSSAGATSTCCSTASPTCAVRMHGGALKPNSSTTAEGEWNVLSAALHGRIANGRRGQDVQLTRSPVCRRTCALSGRRHCEQACGLAAHSAVPLPEWQEGSAKSCVKSRAKACTDSQKQKRKMRYSESMAKGLRRAERRNSHGHPMSSQGQQTLTSYARAHMQIRAQAW